MIESPTLCILCFSVFKIVTTNVKLLCFFSVFILSGLEKSEKTRHIEEFFFIINNISELTTKRFMALCQYFVHTLWIHNDRLESSQYKTKQKLKLSGVNSVEKLLLTIFFSFFFFGILIICNKKSSFL